MSVLVLWCLFWSHIMFYVVSLWLCGLLVVILCLPVFILDLFSVILCLFVVTWLTFQQKTSQVTSEALTPWAPEPVSGGPSLSNPSMISHPDISMSLLTLWCLFNWVCVGECKELTAWNALHVWCFCLRGFKYLFHLHHLNAAETVVLTVKPLAHSLLNYAVIIIKRFFQISFVASNGRKYH